MHRTLLSAALFAAIAFSVGSAQAATFTYHGNLQDAGKPADGTYDLELTLYSSPEGGKVIAGPLVMYKVPVHEGTFSTEADFGLLTHVSGPSWLGVAVRNAGKGDFTALSARAPISAAETATNSSCPGSWSLDGNAGNPVGDYLGTADNQPLTFKVNGATAGQITPGKGAWFSQGTGLYTTSAEGASAFAMGKGTHAGGAESFAGGLNATANQDGSFVWGDFSTASITSATAVNQYIVRAGGGVGINSVPLTSATEVTIRGSLLAADTNTDLAMFPRGSTWGFDMNVQGTGQADGSWNISQTNGSTYTNRLAVRNNGVVINDPANIPANSNTATIAALNIVAPAGSTDALIDMYPHDSANPTLANYWSFLSDKDEFDVIRTSQPTAADPVTHTTYMTLALGSFGLRHVDINGALNADFISASGISVINGGSLSAAANITIGGTATKPGGGPWSAPSDRRIKENIVPISDAIDTVLKLHPVSFHYTPEFRATENNLPDKPYLGFVAQEFAEVFPEAVTRTNKHVPGAAANDPTILELDSNPALITTVAAVQELAVQAQDRDVEVADLRGENAELRSKLDKVLVRLSKLEAGKGK